MIEQKLAEMGIALPEPPEAVGSYLPAVAADKLLMVSGQLPLRDGALIAAGSVVSQVGLEQAQQAARQCVINALAQVRRALEGDFSRLAQVVHVRVYVRSDADFTHQAAVANGASDFLAELLGDAGRHARAAVGVSQLPLGASVEVEMMVQVH